MVTYLACTKNSKQFHWHINRKTINTGGSLIIAEATGYGCVYFAKAMLENNDSLKGKICTVSGSGNVAQYTTEKLLEYGAKVVSLSDSSGTIYDEAGITTEKLEFVKDLKPINMVVYQNMQKSIMCLSMSEKHLGLSPVTLHFRLQLKMKCC